MNNVATYNVENVDYILVSAKKKKLYTVPGSFFHNTAQLLRKFLDKFKG